MADWILLLQTSLDFVPLGLRKLTLVKNIQQLLSLYRIKIKAITAHKLQGIPLRGIVAGRDRDSTISLEPGNRQLQTRCWANTQIDNFTTRGE
jgi:hypothetical protein